MSTQQSSASPPVCPVSATPAGYRYPLYAPEYAADPHGAYRELRARFGSLVPVELSPGVPATLVIGYHDAVRILNDPEHFPADPRMWQRGVAEDCPVRPMLEWRPNALRSAGAEHTRYRQANTAALDGVDLHALHTTVERLAVPLINSFCTTGSADLLTQYAWPLTFQVINAMLGCPPEIGERVAKGMAAIFELDDAEAGNEMLTTALVELVGLKKEGEHNDVTSRLMAHRNGLDDVEMIHQLVTLYGAGIEPLTNLIGNTLLLMLTDERFAGNVLGGSMSARDALDEVLFEDPPMANYCMSYPAQPIMIGDVWLPAHQPVVISLAGCNNDPAIAAGDRTDNRSHLAWSIGPHACPAQSAAYLIAQDAIDQILDALPELRLAVPADRLTWRPGPFARSLAALPVAFPASPPLTVA
ncbi:cytochrome P450 [Phytomonospora endophytica]|uniref:Cytochrome P450 n=1 Tax=Phytomonospora endophytica TaxID=714109 RepID=A0A841FQB3_9ACTN|nr:cytochrome P450 [Phytomonospora endophytica]MBB6034749.1 cytochrome P450 [Phytomonospora endophytica]GIG69048.1 cytochrome P450 [Phytomonospora endophytica]